jgi:hypothetical protein
MSFRLAADLQPAASGRLHRRDIAADGTEEAAMYPTINAEVINARMADLHRQAERRQMIQAARRARRARRDDRNRATPGRTGSVLARRALAALGTRSPRPAR